MAKVKIQEVQFRSFNGGVNYRDNAASLARDEIADALNVTIDERGSATKRLGYERRFANPVGAGVVSNLFHWATRGLLVVQEGPRMRVNDGAAFLTWSTDARCGMTEINSNLVLIHPVDGVRVYDGTTVTGPFTNSPLGNTLATWQGKVWAGGNPTHPARVTRSAIGDPSTWNVNDWTDLKEKDSAKITCLTGASGLDVSGRPGLLAFKEESAYRIYDSATGAYNTIDASIGCGSNIGAVSAYGRTYTVSPRGIYYTNGLDPMVEASAKIEPLFAPGAINQQRADLFCAGRYRDRLYFSVPIGNNTYNSRVIEVHPLGNWVMVHDNASSAYASLGRGETDLVMAHPTVAGLVYNSHRTGADDGAPIASFMQTFWVEPNEGNLVRVRRARFVGFGEFTASVYRDYEVSNSLPTFPVDITPIAAVYDDPDYEYNDPNSDYGPSGFQGLHDTWSVGTGRAISVRVEETSTKSYTGREIAPGVFEQFGAWTLDHVSLMVIELGFH